MGFSRGHQGCQGHRPHDDDNDEEEDNEVEDNDNNDKGISALGLEPGVFARASRMLRASASR